MRQYKCVLDHLDIHNEENIMYFKSEFSMKYFVYWLK